MATYIYQGQGTNIVASATRITADTDLTPSSVSLVDPLQVEIVFAAPLTVEEQSALDQFMLEGGFIPTTATSTFPRLIDLFAGIESTNVTAALGVAVGRKTFNPAAYDIVTATGRTITFHAILEVTGGFDIEASLYNLSAGSVVNNTTLTTNSPTPVEIVSIPLVVAPSPNLPNSLQLYQVQFRLVGVPGPLDLATISGAWLEVMYS